MAHEDMVLFFVLGYQCCFSLHKHIGKIMVAISPAKYACMVGGVCTCVCVFCLCLSAYMRARIRACLRACVRTRVFYQHAEVENA